jgi:DNA-binding transcriptional ArsR family regulator
MQEGPDIARIAAAIAARARSEVLAALMANRACTASELGNLVGVSKATISAHLSKLTDVGLVAVERQGRHRYFRLAGPDVGQLLESLMGVAFRAGAVRLNASPREPALRKARVCYDHLAGELGVAVYEALLRRGALERSGDGLRITTHGRAWFAGLGVNMESLEKQKRILCRPCLDWSERRTHLAGGIGAALLVRIGQLGWARRARNSRIVIFSVVGERSLRRVLADARGTAQLEHL